MLWAPLKDSIGAEPIPKEALHAGLGLGVTGTACELEWKQMNRLVLFLFLAASAATDIPQRLARWKPVEMPYRTETLNARERQEVDKLVAASREMEAIYWQQSDPEALELYKTTKDPNLKKLLFMNGARFDLIDDNKPFVGTKPVPPGRNLY